MGEYCCRAIMYKDVALVTCQISTTISHCFFQTFRNMDYHSTKSPTLIFFFVIFSISLSLPLTYPYTLTLLPGGSRYTQLKTPSRSKSRGKALLIQHCDLPKTISPSLTWEDPTGGHLTRSVHVSQAVMWTAKELLLQEVNWREDLRWWCHNMVASGKLKQGFNFFYLQMGSVRSETFPGVTEKLLEKRIR